MDALAERSMQTRSQIIEDAPAHGRSLAWQQRWAAGIEAGLAEAARGDFATEEEIALVLDRYAER
ncbi:transcriptional regulator (plasmid) [Shinella sp. PSBB067]|uniref:transcriptional regulator n=1 Tax=Shinella sp. PSBB067 TaxID=2715959 RepID=UPI00193C14D5|nr:transcriptional regulator [Shinella sp. PSBB067]QRI61811.1 transcriptional regulator [Shinella sp. PSBB067]